MSDDESRDYDVEDPPAAEVWLAMDESERIFAVEEAHVRTRAPVGGNANAHASIHVVVENRLAEGHAMVVAAYDRFRVARLDRHTTVHALASVVTQHMLAVLEQRPGISQEEAPPGGSALRAPKTALFFDGKRWGVPSGREVADDQFGEHAREAPEISGDRRRLTALLAPVLCTVAS